MAAKLKAWLAILTCVHCLWSMPTTTGPATVLVTAAFVWAFGTLALWAGEGEDDS